MRIAIYHNLPSGGAKRTIGEAVARMADRHEIDVYTLTTANHGFADLRPLVRNYHMYDFEAMPLLGSPWGRLNQASRMMTLRRLGQLTDQIAEDIDGAGYDAVLVEPCQLEVAPSVLQHSAHPNTVYYCHEPPRRLYEPMPWRPYDAGPSKARTALDAVDPLPNLYHGMLRRRDRANTHSAGKVLVNSRFVQGTVQEIYGINSSVCYHGVDVEQFAPIGMEREAFVLTVGSLTPLKGMDFLIQAIGRIPDKHRPPLVIASNFQNPPERTYLEELAAAGDVDLRLMGNISDELLVNLYNRAAVTVYAPIREPFGLVAIESMACGTPVVGVREGGIAETVVDGETGLLVERNANAFADAVQRLLEDARLRDAYGANGRAHVEATWTWEQAVERLESHLNPSS